MTIPIMGYVAVGSNIIPAIIGLGGYKQRSRDMKLFTAFTVIVCLNVSLEYILGAFQIRNYIVSEIFLLVEVPFMGFLFHRSVAAHRTRSILVFCVSVFALFWLVDEIFFVNRNQLNNILSMVSGIILVVMSSVTLNSFLKSAERRLTAEPIFWILSGVILYSSGSFVIFAMSNDLMNLGVEYFVFGWYINWILLIMTNLLYTKGLLCKSRA